MFLKTVAGFLYSFPNVTIKSRLYYASKGWHALAIVVYDLITSDFIIDESFYGFVKDNVCTWTVLCFVYEIINKVVKCFILILRLCCR